MAAAAVVYSDHGDYVQAQRALASQFVGANSQFLSVGSYVMFLDGLLYRCTASAYVAQQLLRDRRIVAVQVKRAMVAPAAADAHKAAAEVFRAFGARNKHVLAEGSVLEFRNRTLACVYDNVGRCKQETMVADPHTYLYVVGVREDVRPAQVYIIADAQRQERRENRYNRSRDRSRSRARDRSRSRSRARDRSRSRY